MLCTASIINLSYSILLLVLLLSFLFTSKNVTLMNKLKVVSVVLVYFSIVQYVSQSLCDNDKEGISLVLSLSRIAIPIIIGSPFVFFFSNIFFDIYRKKLR